jgi:hypothetical protein
MKPEIQNFISEYANAVQRKTNREYAERYGVEEHTIGIWVKDNQDTINEIIETNIQEYSRIFKLKLEKASEILDNLLVSGDEKIQLGAVKIVFDKTIPNKSSSEIELKGKGTNKIVNGIQALIDQGATTTADK